MVLSNSGEIVVLKDSGGNTIDQITYKKEDVKEGKSIKVANDATRTLSTETTYTFGMGDFGTPGKDPYNRINVSNKEFNPTTFFSNGTFSLPEGVTEEEDTESIIVNEQMIISVSMEDGSHSVDLPSGILITRSDGGTIDATKLSADNIETSSLAGFDLGMVVEAGLQWGIPNMGMEFSEAITLNIFVGTAKNGQTLNILRSVSQSFGWTSDGIVPPATCTVSSGICSFQATKASYFAATTIVPTPTPTSTSTPAPSALASSSTSSSGDSGSNSQVKSPTCEDAKPGSAPTLLSVLPGVNSVTLNWSKALDPVTHYLLSYGREPGVAEFGNPNIGGKDSTSYTVYDLSDRTRYYFKVLAVNNCKPGDFSNELSAIPIAAKKLLTTTASSPKTLGIARDQEISKDQQKNLNKNQSYSNTNIFSPILNFFTTILRFFGRIFD